MTPIFLDTSALIAVANRRDHWHGQAEATWKELLTEKRRLVTTTVVLIEIGDGLSRIDQRHIALAVRNVLITFADIVALAPSIDDSAWKLFADRSDKEWGLTDCISMTVMSQMNITEAFTLDHHFRQAGFETVP